jgi:signal transduction histidine kinase
MSTASTSNSDARLRRLVWALVAVDLAGCGVFLWLRYVGGASPRYAPSYGSSADLVFGLAQLGSLGFGALIAIRQPRHPVGWLLLASATVFILDQPVTYYVIYAIHVSGRALPGADLLGSIEQIFWVPGMVPVAVLLPLVFPTGTLLSRRWRLVLWIALLGSAATIAASIFGSHQDTTSIIGGVRPWTAPAEVSRVADALTPIAIVLPLSVIAAVVSLALRYRRGGAEERHQIKWLLFAISLFGFGFLLDLAGFIVHAELTWLQTVASLGLILIPVAAAVSVLKYRLYDIDIIISRTLVYGALATFITGVYVAIVVGIGHLVGSGGQPNLALSIVATAIVAVGFQPVRERLQKFANRLVYGKRATPYEVLSAFSERVAESYAAAEVLPRMARVLAEGTGAARADVWLRTGPLLRQAGSWPEGAEEREAVRVTNDTLLGLLEADRAVEVRHQGELLGALTITKRAGESLTPIEESLLNDLAHQAGLVLKNVGLTSELLQRLEDLRASRQRLVGAQDEERRRLERNLHDGAQQNLVALKVKLGLAEAMAEKDPARAKELVAHLKGDADEALETLRDLARGIYPPLLADKGLAAALEAQSRKATLPVEVETDGIGRYPQETEAAVYFCCLEALQNVQKYARATAAGITITVRSGWLSFDVHDNGAGFDPKTVPRGAGLQNMADRLDALGGSVDLESAPGAGTMLRGRLPVEVSEAVVPEAVA